MRKIFISIFACFILAAVFYNFRTKPDPVSVYREAPISKNPRVLDKVLICGVCRNVAKAVPNTIESVRALGSCFLDYRAIIYENNSTDKTRSLLHQWAEEDPHVIFISEQLSSRKLRSQLAMKIQNRTEKIARARNIVLDRAMDKMFDDYQYVVWADLDFLEPWDVESILDTIMHPKHDWDAVFANGSYDLFALRSPEFPIGFELLGDSYWGLLDEIRQQLVLDRDGPWKKVYSAFGGLAIYKRDAMRGCSYSGVVTKNLEKVVHQWLCLARERNQGLFLDTYEELISKNTPIELKKPLLGTRSQYPEELASCFPGGHVIWFSCTKDATLPWTCEHIPFHASMVLHGRDRLFINPNLRCNQ
jgi:glycosyltransferase involved in cell wall biosynthesis